MKAKKGKCVDCPIGTPEKYLIAKRCEFHYKLHRSKVNAGKKHNVEKREYKKELNVFFASQIREIGESAGVILPKAWLDLLNWQAKDNVKPELDLQGKKIVVKEK